MRNGLYTTRSTTYPFFKVRNGRGLWVGYHEGANDSDFRINQTKRFWKLSPSSHDLDEDIIANPIAPLCMTEW